MDLIDKFRAKVEDMGHHVRATGDSLIINYCPNCGTSKFKVSFTSAKGNVLGQCFRGECQKGFSAGSYLRMCGIDQSEISDLLGTNFQKALDEFAGVKHFDIFPTNFAIKLDQSKEKPPEDIVGYVSKLFSLSWKDHPVAKYAAERGVTEKHWDIIKLDDEAAAVAFLCIHEGKYVGYQKRYINPVSKHMKTKTAYGFKAHEHIIILDGGPRIAVCEGPFSAVGATSFGFTGVCTFGSNAGYTQMEKILKLCHDRGQDSVYLAFDKDEAGEKGFQRLWRFFSMNGLKVFKVVPIKGTDLNDAWMAGFSYLIEEQEARNPYVPSAKLFE